jgi:hypothetical protein
MFQPFLMAIIYKLCQLYYVWWWDLNHTTVGKEHKEQSSVDLQRKGNTYAASPAPHPGSQHYQLQD